MKMNMDNGKFKFKLFIPEQMIPSPMVPSLHEQLYDPSILKHVCDALLHIYVHSSISEIKWNMYSYNLAANKNSFKSKKKSKLFM